MYITSVRYVYVYNVCELRVCILASTALHVSLKTSKSCGFNELCIPMDYTNSSVFPRPKIIMKHAFMLEFFENDTSFHDFQEII